MSLHDALLRLFQKSFRIEYGEEMRHIFVERRGQARGFNAVAILWIETLADLVRTTVPVTGGTPA